MPEKHYVRWFKELSIGDVPLVGGKNASLGEMVRELVPLGVRVPNGFAVTAQAFRDALSAADAWPRLHAALDGLDKGDVRALARAGARCREIVYAAGLPREAEAEVLAAYLALQEEYGEDLSVAVRSSATAEDLPTASFAGQHESYLNVRGAATAAGCRAPLPGLAVHRPGDLLPDRQGLRPLQGRPLGRRAEDGPLGPRKLGRDVLGRHRDRLQGRGVHHRCLGHRRERGPGCGRRGRVLRPQAHLPARLPLRAAPRPGCQEDQDGLCRGAHPRAGGQPADERGGAAPLLPRRRAGAAARRLCHPHRGSLFPARRPAHAHGHRVGLGRRSTTSSTSSRPGRRR